MLLLLLLLHQTWSNDIPKEKNFTIKKHESCPDVGYFFRWESNPNALPGCFLCFCQYDGTSLCWRREDNKCDKKNYHPYYGLKHKRPPRSPGFGDIFFKDAANSFFGKKAEGDCTPYESSFSDDCPPADWCTGCTVCDCTGDGKWECHLLSFCPDGQGKKTVKKRKPNRNAVSRRKNNSNTKTATPPTTKATTTSTPRPKKLIKKSIPISLYRNQTHTRGKIPVKFKNKSRKYMPRQYMFIKKDVSTRKPVTIENRKPKLIAKPDHELDPKQMARKVVKRVIAAVTKIVKNDIKSNKTKIINHTQKRSIKKTVNNKNKNKPSPRPKYMEKHSKKVVNDVTVMPKKDNKRKRRKRNVAETVANATSELQATNASKVEDFVGNVESNITESAKNATSTEPNISIFSQGSDYKATEALTSYYKYVIDDSLNNLTELHNLNKSLNNVVTKSSTHFTINNAVNNIESNFNKFDKPILYVGSDIKAGVKNKSNNLLTLSDILSSNDLKNRKWSRIKLFKEKKIKYDLLHNSRYKNNTTEKKKINRNDVGRKIGLPRKYNLRKVINTHNRVYVNSDTTKAASNKLNDLQYFIRNLLKNENKNKTKANMVKKKKVAILRFMKKFFNKIFNTRKVSNNTKYNIKFDKQHLVETLCESFGPCKIDARNILLVKAKIDKLHNETVEILGSIQIVKGLLKLVDIPIIENDVHSRTSKKIRDDLQKLNIILKGKYIHNNLPLSETQKFQIEYIKNNTNYFIKAISTFAETLNETIALLTNREINNRVSRNTRKKDHWEIVKDLLLKYNLIQNTFIKKIYETITKAEIKDKCSKEKTHNSVSMETYSKNIVRKLRRLKNLATMLNSRRKRQVTKDDDNMEYLLMLMDYLLKQSYSSDGGPPNDGIDLLIDAIRSAPDINLIRKKVLENIPTDIFPTRTVKPVDKSQIHDVSIETSKSLDDKELSDTEDKISTTDEPTTKVTKEMLDVKEDPRRFIPIDDFDDNDDKYDFNRKNLETNELFGGHDVTTPTIELLTKASLQNHKETLEDNNKVRTFEMYSDMDENIAVSDNVTETTSTAKIDVADIDTEGSDKTNERRISESLENVEKRSKLDWVESNFDTEITESKLENITEAGLISTSTEKVSVTTSSKPQVDVSSITKELVDEEEKRIKINADEVMFMKQMDLLNSLDYATEKTEFDETFKDNGEISATYL